MPEIEKGDSRALGFALLILGAATVLGTGLFLAAGALGPAVGAWMRQDLDARLRLVTAVMMLLLAGPALGMGAYVWRLGRRTVRAQRYPPPGVRVLRDTAVVAGPRAVRLGTVMQWFAALIAAAGLLAAVFLWRLVTLLASRGG
jgi:hypothetical protein